MLPFTKRFQRCGDGARWCAVLAGATLLSMGCKVPGEPDVFIQDGYYAVLTVEVKGAGGVIGYVGSDRTSIDCREGSGACVHTLDLDRVGETVVRLSATPDPGWAFSNWAGDCTHVTDLSGEVATVYLEIEQPYYCITTFIQTVAPSPPVVSINSPPDNTSVTVNLVTVAGTATDNFGVAELVYTLNGSPAVDVFASLTGANWSFDVPGLALGSNTITVLARDADGLEGSASITVIYSQSGNPVLACNSTAQGTLATGEEVEYTLAVPSTDLAYSVRARSVSTLDGTYQFPSVVPQPLPPGEHYAGIFTVSSSSVQFAKVKADNTGGDYEVLLECERDLAFNTNVTAIQPEGLIQLYRYADPVRPIHIGAHRTQAVHDIAGGTWYGGGSFSIPSFGNGPPSGYWPGSSVDSLQPGIGPLTLLLGPLGVSPGDPVDFSETYTFALSTVAPPTALTLDPMTDAATVTEMLTHLGHVRFYSFQGAPGESYTVSLTHPAGPGLAGEVNVTRVGPGTYYLPSFAVAGPGRTTAATRAAQLGPFVLNAADTYIIRVETNAGPTNTSTLAETMGEYTLTLQRN